MPQITRELLRKRAEHNEGIISTLEEISLHQEELEAINEILGMTCRKLKILYLQNNIIGKMEHLSHMKDLTYLNLALNNITRIEGLQNCEFLRKLDLTVNFIDFDTLKESIEHLVDRYNLEELYLMGNPCQAGWSDRRQIEHYVIAKLPQLKVLDGTEITKSLQITARQQLPKLETELEVLAEQVRKRKEERAIQKRKEQDLQQSKEKSEKIEKEKEKRAGDNGNKNNNGNDDPYDREEMTENTPEDRIKIYQELAQQKREKEERANVNAPKSRDYVAEQQEAIEKVRLKEQELTESEIKQKNEGGWEFRWDEETKPGHVILDLAVARHLDSSLIDVDVHPTYVSVIIKSKLLRLKLPAEVKASESKCQRSKTTGWLHVIMPKVNPHDNAVTIRGDLKAKQNAVHTVTPKASEEGRVKIKPKAKSLQEQMLEEATKASSNSLLDQDVGNGSTVFTNLQKIVPAISAATEENNSREINTID